MDGLFRYLFFFSIDWSLEVFVSSLSNQSVTKKTPANFKTISITCPHSATLLTWSWMFQNVKQLAFTENGTQSHLCTRWMENHWIMLQLLGIWESFLRELWNSRPKKAYKMLWFLLGTCKDFRNIKSHILLFNSFVNSQLNYCTVAWNPMYQKYIDQIEDIQKKFALKFNTGINDTYEVRCANLKLRSQESIRIENDLLFQHKSLHQHLDSDNFMFSSSNRETRNRRAVEPPIARTNLGLDGPFYRMMSSSNNLELKPEDLNNPSIESFKNSILKIL